MYNISQILYTFQLFPLLGNEMNKISKLWFYRCYSSQLMICYLFTQTRFTMGYTLFPFDPIAFTKSSEYSPRFQDVKGTQEIAVLHSKIRDPRMFPSIETTLASEGDINICCSFIFDRTSDDTFFYQTSYIKWCCILYYRYILYHYSIFYNIDYFKLL